MHELVQFLNLIYGQYSSEPIIIEETNFGVFENNTNTINGFIYHIFLISNQINNTIIMIVKLIIKVRNQFWFTL